MTDVAEVTVHHTGNRLVVDAVGDVRAVGRVLACADPSVKVRRVDGQVTVGWPDAQHLTGVAGLRWTSAARRWVQNRRRVATDARRLREDTLAVVSAGPAAARRQLDGYRWLSTLDDHQAVNVAALTVDGGWGGCVFDEQGTGKTPTTIATFDVLHDQDRVDVLLVVAPKSMVGEWPVEVERFADGLYRTSVLSGSRAEKAAAIESGADVLVCNYETVVSMGPNLALLADRARVMLAVDESFFVKNPASARTAAIRSLREHCTHAVVLCGTPAPNAPGDLVTQFDLVDFGHTFRDVRLSDDRDTAAAQVREVLNSRGTYLRSLKQHVLPHLPARSFTEVPVEMEPQQAAAYRAALNDLVLDLRNTSDQEFSRTITSFLERRAALLRICSDPMTVIPGYSETPVKMLALDQIVTELAEQNEKVVVWSFYRASLDRIAARYAGHGLVRIDGSVTDVSERREAVRAFQDDPDVKVFVGNPAAAGAGLTLHAARYAVYESLSNQAAHFLQSLDRIHRRGQTREVTYITLLCRESIEEPEYARLLEKADRQADLLQDAAAPRPTRSVMLDELAALLSRAPAQ